MDATLLIVQTLMSFLNIYLLLIFVRILLSWFQTAEWAYGIMSFLSPITDPYLNIFRSFIPPLGGLDISPIVAIFLLQIISQMLGSVPSMMGGF
ncbi:YggT family protein [Crocosphaera sp. UHCC 0190]|uniref:YggT family protein n=1 Tax=Crocosphaera sp. UHCC 0190 TaxID=3110246 RepID=UPI002B20EF83|nr:YggT family protein [Crocosphaera sp. UHCC 0190]MEA5510221.1 YggT family protein [Crocosphaera sp. UHCC 0190]